MRKFLRHIVSNLALVLFIATLVIEVRSFWTTDTIFVVYGHAGSEQIKCMRGQVMIRHIRPEDGLRGGFGHMSHRVERVSSLPPPLWINEPRERWWLIFRFIQAPWPAQKIKAKIDAEAALVAWEKENPSLRRGTGAWEYEKLLQANPQLYIKVIEARRALEFANPSYWELVFPLWLVMVLMSLLPGARLISVVRRRQRIKQGCCRTCGYDLRATPERCPECGTVVPSTN